MATKTLSTIQEKLHGATNARKPLLWLCPEANESLYRNTTAAWAKLAYLHT